MNSDSEHDLSSESQDNNEEDFDVEVEEEGATDTRTKKQDDAAIDSHDEIPPYSGESVADDEWLANYNQRRAVATEQLAYLNSRLDGSVPVSAWCECGKCSTELLIKAKECNCCLELEPCFNTSNDEEVTQEVGFIPQCITDRPGFQPLCREPWSLKFAADRYKTKFNCRYKQTRSKERFFRAVAYREFTRLVHGPLGAKRMPLPACAYHAIRSKFKVPTLATQRRIKK